jgi:hypothetical protein
MLRCASQEEKLVLRHNRYASLFGVDGGAGKMLDGFMSRCS